MYMHHLLKIPTSKYKRDNFLNTVSGCARCLDLDDKLLNLIPSILHIQRVLQQSSGQQSL